MGPTVLIGIGLHGFPGLSGQTMPFQNLDYLDYPERKAGANWRLPRFVWWLARIGTKGYAHRIRRRLAVTNVIAVMVSLMTIPYIVLCATYDWDNLWPAVLVFTPQIILFALTPLLHRYGSFAAGLYLCCIWLIFGVCYCWFFGRESGLHFFFLPGAAASMLIFGAERLGASAFVMLVALAAFLVTEILFVAPIWFLSVDPTFLRLLFYMTVPFSFLLIFTTVFFAFKEAIQAEVAFEKEYRFSERLLQNILPRAVAMRLKDERIQIVADHIDNATILFADIVNFTPRAANWKPQEAVAFLSQIFSRFDAIATLHGLEKIKTVGDAYMVAGGLPEPRPDHEANVARMALDILKCCDEFSREIGERVEVRIGLDAGPVVAGVIGQNKLLYDVWGDTVNTAAHLESHGAAGRIQVTECLKSKLEDRFEFEFRGEVSVKGKGMMRLWFLVGERTIPAAGQSIDD